MDRYDTFWRRFFAGLIDGLILIPITVFIGLAPTNNVFTIILGVFITYSSVYVYSIFFHWKTGQTIGKKVMNIRVIDVAENKLLTLRKSFLRDSVYILLESIGFIFLIIKAIQLGYAPSKNSGIFSYLEWLGVLWFLLEIITMLTNEKRRAFHDFIAGSVVIRNEYWKVDSIENSLRE